MTNHGEVKVENNYGMTQLHHAAVRGDVEGVNSLLRESADPLKTNEQGQLPLHSALLISIIPNDDLKARKTTIARNLIKAAPTTITQKDISGDTALHLMAVNGFDEILNELLRQTPALAEIQNTALNYPIHVAILNDQEKTADALLSIKGVINLRAAKQRTPLHYAALNGNPKIVKACCNAKADLNARDHEEKTALILAAKQGNIEALGVLLDEGADPLLVDNENHSVLYYSHHHDAKTENWLREKLSKEVVHHLEASSLQGEQTNSFR